MKKIKIFVAEDYKVTRDLLIEGLQSYAEKKFGDENYFVIERAESFQKGLLKLAESEKSKSFYDVFFADIDFSEDNKGGELDSGYKLIEKAFEVCPVTNIYTYSGQFSIVKKLWTRYEELRDRGLIVGGMNKSHGKGGEEAWLNENLDKIVEKLSEENYLLNLWQNHQLILDELKKDYFFNSISGLQKFHEIQSNLESILVLLKSRKSINADLVLFRLILQLYHRSLEIFCESNKKEDDIFAQSEKNKSILAKLINKEETWELGDKRSALRKIVAFSNSPIIKFGYRVNDVRNKSVHPNENFKTNLANILFANLTLAFFVNGKKDIYTESFENIPQIENEKGFKDLKELIENFR